MRERVSKAAAERGIPLQLKLKRPGKIDGCSYVQQGTPFSGPQSRGGPRSHLFLWHLHLSPPVGLAKGAGFLPVCYCFMNLELCFACL